MHANTAESELEWRTLDSWGSMSGSSLKGSVENGTSRSKRCFQTKYPSEQSYSQNYYAGTGLLTPGPGSYSEMSLPKETSVSFGSSRRVLSESGRLWCSNDNSVPPPGTYNIEKSSRERYLKDLMGVTRYKIKILKQKLDSATGGETKSSTDMIKAELNVLKQRLRAVREEIELTVLVEDHNKPRTAEAKKTSFNSTDKKFYQKPVKIQESPTFYMSDAEWDFGAATRPNTSDMSAFNYTTRVLLDREREELENLDTLVGARRSKPRCRDTDFFGPNSDYRSITPGVGTYDPPLVPPKASELQKYRHDNGDSLGCSTSSKSPWTKRSDGKYSFTFSRSCTVTPLMSSSVSLTSDLTAPSSLRQSSEQSAKNGIAKSSYERKGLDSSMPMSPVTRPDSKKNWHTLQHSLK